ncbi:hypothetical protein PtB15_2B25 [Puccinia triticina]|nr:hypothetical protein PtB15_2B25 [Puccinia triticina]
MQDLYFNEDRYRPKKVAISKPPGIECILRKKPVIFAKLARLPIHRIFSSSPSSSIMSISGEAMHGPWTVYGQDWRSSRFRVGHQVRASRDSAGLKADVHLLSSRAGLGPSGSTSNWSSEADPLGLACR